MIKDAPDSSIDGQSESLVVEDVVSNQPWALVRTGLINGPGGFLKRVAVKSIPPTAFTDDQARQRLIEAINQGADLDHPSIVQIYDAVPQKDGGMRISSECVAGHSLREVIARAQQRAIPLPIHLVVWIMRGVCEAVDSAYDEGVAHGHITPSNILLGYNGEVKTSDYRVASSLGPTPYRASAGGRTGAFDYMAPEQLDTWVANPSTDVFSLGCVLYELTVGQHPFNGATDDATAQAIRLGQCDKPTDLFPEYPQEMQAIILRALSPDPDLRYQSAGGLQHDLIQVTAGDSESGTRGAMASFMTILFPEHAKSASARWQAPSTGIVRQTEPPAEPDYEIETSTAKDEGSNTWMIAGIGIVVVSLLFWLLLYPLL